MSTRAIQIESLLTGLVHPTTGLQMTGGTAYFYSAGTSNAKNVWTEKEKTNPYTSYALSVIGGAQLYGDGEYKIVVKDADGVTCYTWDNVRLRYPNYYVRAVTATTSQTADDDFLEVNTTSGAVTINLLTVTSWVQPLKVMHVAGANSITLEPSGAELIDGAANYTYTAVGTIVEVVADAAGTGLRKAGIRSTTLDADGDTGIELDRAADNDTVYIKTGGVDRMVINSTATDVDALSIGGVAVTAATGANVVNTTTAQNIAGPKAFTDGLTITGAPLKLANAAEFATITGNTTTQTVTEVMAGGYTSANDSGRIAVRSKSHASLPGTVSLYGTNGSSAVEGLRVLNDGSVNIANLVITGGRLAISPSVGTGARVTTGSTAVTDITVMPGGYTSTNDAAAIEIRSKDASSIPGTVSIYATNGVTGVEALRAKSDGTINLPVGLEIGGVAVIPTAAEIYEASVGAQHASGNLGGDLTGTYRLSKVGHTVTLTWSPATHASASSATSGAGVIPAAYRPPVAVYNMFLSASGHVEMVSISTAGTITFEYRDWAGSGFSNIACASGSASWVVD